jgi:hypothetical protein
VSILTWSLVVLLGAGSGRTPSEQFLRANYVREDPRGYETGYARVGANRFRQAWVVAREELNPFAPYYYRSVPGERRQVSEAGTDAPFVPSPAFLDAVAQVVHCLPQLAAYRNELYAPERVRLAGGQEIISFYLYRVRDAWDTTPLWLSSFVLLQDATCYAPPATPAKVDIDFGGDTLEVWDVFEFDNQSFVLAEVDGYEARGMRLFRRQADGFSEALRFWFSFLGSE